MNFRCGDVTKIDHVPDADVAAGDVIVIGELTCIAHLDIKAGELGALTVDGGIYAEAKKVSGTAFVAGDRLYWSGTAVTKSASGNKQIGFATAAAASSATVCDLFHRVA